jgi:hypothetical protein
VFVESHPRRSPNSFLTLAPIPCPLSRKSFPFISFADPHPLTPLQSYRFKNSGGGLTPDYGSIPLPPIFRTLFQVPYPASPLLAVLTKTRGVWGYSSRFGTRPTCRRFDVQTFPYPLSFHTLANSFARRKNSTPFFSSDSALFPKNHPGWGGPPSLISRQANPVRSQW